MKRTSAFLCVAGIMGTSLAACTPKPVAADPVAEDFIAALENHDVDALKSVVDDPDIAAEQYGETYSGLQAEGLDVELTSIDQQDSVATANYSVTWDLPKDRELTYDAKAVLTKVDKTWTVNWESTALHPKLGAHQHLELRPVVADRASVVSSDGVELMSPGVQYRLLVDTSSGDMRALAGQLAPLVNQDAGELATNLEEAGETYSVGLYNEGDRNAIQGANLPGVRFNEEPALITKETGFATDIMSRVRSIVADKLDGTNGWRIAVVNENGASLSDVEFHDATPSPAIRVGIDYNVQRAAEQAVDLRADSEAMLVAMRPSTGEILAVAQTDAADKKGDLALSGQFPPGSVFKIITASAGVDKQGLNSGSIVPCPGTMELYGRTVTNDNGFSLGSVPLEEAFAQSCNTTFANISTDLGEGELKEEGSRFGLGLDYDIPGLTTITGSIPEGETPLERTEAGYGQGADLVSPFGMVLASSTVAAGVRPTPTLIAGQKTTASENPDGPSPVVIDNLRTLMRATVTSGTARGMGAGGTIYGKTGEAEINGGSHAWFTGFRDDDIAFATLVVLGGGSETSVAITDSFFKRLDELRTQQDPEQVATGGAE
ncbi:cell division protein FtsI [Corynebacterium sp. HMSC077D10]|uniref:penicillin-binding transpeptidase domain-containing protein n=1 Tax=unclassified Corynebacterium TaxID=2624378 RepID=UPI0008A1215D|nr:MULTISPECIES: penicillin-binding transpeptidase domain-containing protein [unclassified Corynebacterium]OFN39643.1 cell division protein FtsI [Corynebacterium sp. HMSC072G08]OFP21055.1 cell division protein FtsI [Corynebacterium sp. HMSC065A05]OFP69462.1 cell division protein FtsI [Corynebacterium sp. HMSC077D10]